MMQSARKLILVDECDREYKRLQRPNNAVAKSKHSLEVSNTLRDSTLADDKKSQRIRGRSPSILELAQTSSGGSDRASQPAHHCASITAATAAATATTDASIASYTIAFADDSETRQTS